MVDQFTICVLLYGNHTDLASRCVGSIAAGGLPDGLSLRIGLNAVHPDTKRLVASLCPHAEIYEYSDNKHKYPVMRDMVHGDRRITTPYTMWFDDDSYIETPLQTWLPSVAAAMADADLIGSPYTMKWRGNQRAYVKAQPWYGGNDPATRLAITFITGGWWTIRTPLLYRYNYPWPSLDHCGGDTMLGELCLQQKLRMKKFRTNVRINADWAGRESASIRRGFAQPPLGADYDDSVPAISVKPIIRL